MNTTVLSSYDPNFKEVSPQGTGPQGYIDGKDSILTYVIHFQNTGSYYAQNIVVVDTIDTDLNIGTLRPGYSDHNFTTTVDENRVARFSFKNINLPWQSQYGDALSSGMFVYSIKLKKNLAPLTQIKNKAAIYFDYNEPVITNTTLNTISLATGLSALNARMSDNSVLFPNPASNHVTLNFASKESAAGHLTIFDLSGREVVSKDVTVNAGENSLTENTSSFQDGVYLVQVKTAEQVICKKLIVSK
ncbi:MAG: T9SS type A sorting domain-containing protein [Bacteroidia bacterium]|nr:T9SS type A sorting domain-containing protein [Bacteroidia bacterium]